MKAYIEQKRGVNAPVFIAAMQVIFAAALALITSIVWHWPLNALPLFYLMTSVSAYALTYSAAKEKE